MEREERMGVFERRFNEILNLLIEDFIPKLPEKIRELVESELVKLRELIMDARAPRFAIVGRCKSGKSSLINAIYGSEVAKVGSVKSMTGLGKWYEYKNEKGTISILDTRGLGEGSTPKEKFIKESVKEEIYSSIDINCPDALLLLCKAKEVDSYIDEDIKNFFDIKSYIQKKHGYNPPVVGIITQVDELDPVNIVDPPYEDSEKQKNITVAKKALEKKLNSRFEDVVEVIPTSAYMRFSNNNVLYDRRWNIDTLIEYLIERVPGSAQMELAKITQFKSVQKKIAKVLIGSAVAITGGVGTQPIPVADLPIITSIQIGMIIGIGYISGRTMSKKSAIEFMTSMGLNVGTAFVLRELARALVKLIPVAGNAVSGTVAAASTWGIGNAAIAYFIDKKSPEETKRIFETETKKGKRTTK